MLAARGARSLRSPTETPRDVPGTRWTAEAEREVAIRELVRGRLGLSGPITAPHSRSPWCFSRRRPEEALMALESEGVVLRGRFAGGTRRALEVVRSRLLARIHRYTLNRLRAEIEPVSSADFTRFLLEWQRVEPMTGPRGSRVSAAVIEQLDGFEVPAGAWETEVLSARCEAYDPDSSTPCVSRAASHGDGSVTDPHVLPAVGRSVPRR